jgi:hypothetical protein
MSPSNSAPRDIQDLPIVLRQFVLDPVGLLRAPFSMTWRAIFSMQLGLAMISGALVGLISGSFLDFLAGLLIFPIASVGIALIFSLFFYYYFSFFQATFLDFRRLHSITSLAMTPYFVIHLISGFLPPADLIGFAITSVLIVVGLVEQFGLDRRTVARLAIGLGLIFILAWSFAQYRQTKLEKTHQSRERDEMPVLPNPPEPR